MKFKFIDLFAGIGGIRIPFEKLGGECVFTSEYDRFCQITYKENFGELPQGDIRQFGNAVVVPVINDVARKMILAIGYKCEKENT